jgi:hypothetical protein
VTIGKQSDVTLRARAGEKVRTERGNREPSTALVAVLWNDTSIVNGGRPNCGGTRGRSCGRSEIGNPGDIGGTAGARTSALLMKEPEWRETKFWRSSRFQMKTTKRTRQAVRDLATHLADSKSHGLAALISARYTMRSLCTGVARGLLVPLCSLLANAAAAAGKPIAGSIPHCLRLRRSSRTGPYSKPYESR